MHKLLSFIAVLLLSVSLHAQENRDVSSQQMARLQRRTADQLMYNGYTISVQSALAGNYGFDIYKDSKLVFSQRRNPFTKSPIGLRSKDDVIKIARWHITQFNGGAPSEKLLNAPLPKNLAQKLNVQMR